MKVHNLHLYELHRNYRDTTIYLPFSTDIVSIFPWDSATIRIHYIIISSIELKEYRIYYKDRIRITFLKKSVIMTSFRIRPLWSSLRLFEKDEPFNTGFFSWNILYLGIYDIKESAKKKLKAIHACFCISCAKIFASLFLRERDL